MTTDEVLPESPPKLFIRRHLPIAVGAVALVTLGAFENRAVNTALPTIAQEFDAIGSVGVANAAPIASYVVGLSLAGLWADRSGPVPALRAGVMGFAVAQIMVGAATGMPLFVAGRLLGGLAEGLIDVGLMVLVAQVLPPELRPRMFSVFAAAWILPSVLGPFVTGLVTEQASWRWVFLGALGFLVPTWFMIQPAINQAQRQPRPDGDSVGTESPPSARVISWALAAATAVFGLTLAGNQLNHHLAAAAALIVVCFVVAALSAVHLLPRGTFRLARGLPTTVAMRGVAGVAFMGVGMWLPLLLTVVHDVRPSMAGVSLSVTGVMWAVGSWLQGRDHRYSRATVLRAGLAAITVGLTVTSLLALTALPLYVGLAGWAVGACGMGMATSALSVLVLDQSDHTNQGRNSGAGQTASSLSLAMSFVVSGTAIAADEPEPGRAVFAAIIIGGALVALLGTLASGRVTVSN